MPIPLSDFKYQGQPLRNPPAELKADSTDLEVTIWIVNELRQMKHNNVTELPYPSSQACTPRRSDPLSDVRLSSRPISLESASLCARPTRPATAEYNT